MDNNTEIHNSLDFKQVHTLLSLIQKELTIQDHNFMWYPTVSDRSYYAQLMNIGVKIGTIIHPDSVDKYLELFPDQFKFFGVEYNEAIAKRQALIDQHKAQFPDQVIQEPELPENYVTEALSKDGHEVVNP
jgi:hypothetical protein